MLLRWQSQRRTPAAAAWLAGAVLTWIVWRSATSWRRLDGGTGVNRERPSVCRSDMEVNTLPPMAHDHNQMINDLFTYFTQPNKRSCRRILRFGGADPAMHGDAHEPIMDGAKYVCMDPEFSLLSADDCLVYSFGIGMDWSFDWDMERFGCTVYAFDPSINTTRSQNGSILFLQQGVGGRDGADHNGWQVRTLDSFVRRLRHADRTIHYLKMDVEADEWDVLRQQMSLGRESVLFKNVEQLGIELHFTHRPLRYRDVYRTLLDMQELGFYPFWYEPNLIVPPAVVIPGLASKMPNAIEVVWMKTACVGRTRLSGDRSSVS